MKIVSDVHAIAPDSALEKLQSSVEGLDEKEVVKRRDSHGKNQLHEEKSRSTLIILLDQFRSIVILILLGAALFAFATNRLPEAIALVAVTLINTAIGFFTELKATRSMEALRRLSEGSCRVKRSGEPHIVRTADLVPGDIVILEVDDLVPADLRIIEARGLRVNEAALTGESVPVNKGVDSVSIDYELHERSCMLYKGTSVGDGEALGVVVATGMATELGKISRLTERATEQSTPLQKRLDQLGKNLAWITLGVATMVGVTGLVVGRDPLLMVETSIALGIAAIPEGLPIVATIALARGMWLMAKRNALVNRLTAVEALGATTVICTDKTGTLTENDMILKRIETSSGEYILQQTTSDDQNVELGKENDLVQRLLRISILCSNVRSEGEEETFKGDPTEVALVEAAVEEGLAFQQTRSRYKEIKEIPFDSKRMMMATYHQPQEDDAGNNLYVAVKGAPDAILLACDKIAEIDEVREMTSSLRSHWEQQAKQLADKGMRLIGVAEKNVNSETDDPYEELTFIGLAALEDPPKEDVEEAIDQCQQAGMRVIMITGDRPETANSIAESVGMQLSGKALRGEDLVVPDELSEKRQETIARTSVFARVTPEQKFHLVNLFQERGEVVAMTGDGVNDTPALKQADIGVAMGLRGTDAAKQVADMVLRDDRFSSIVAAVKHGRIIFANIRKSIMFMLSTNIAEIMVVALASLALLPIPLKPLQILFLNVLTDVFPALALGVGIGAADVMSRPPKKSGEAVLTSYHWWAIFCWSLVIGISVLSGLLIAMKWFGFEEKQAVTVSFLTLGFAKLWFVLNLRDENTSLWANDVVHNPWIWVSWAVCIVLLITAVYFPPLAMLLETKSPGLSGWLLILGLSLVPVAASFFAPQIRFYTLIENEE